MVPLRVEAPNLIFGLQPDSQGDVESRTEVSPADAGSPDQGERQRGLRGAGGSHVFLASVDYASAGRQDNTDSNEKTIFSQGQIAQNPIFASRRTPRRVQIRPLDP